jgi:tetrapyrrole methylase family protein/MazG family protein
MQKKELLPGGIVLLGLGPGEPDLLTREAWEVLANAQEIYLRTCQHPVVDSLPPHLKIFSFDDIYDQADSFSMAYDQIIEKVLALGKRPQGVIYAVPGNPFVAETTSLEITRKAREQNLPCRVVNGLSFIEPLFIALELDPFPYVSLVDAFDLAAGHVPLFPPDKPAIVAQVYSREVASEVKLTLMTLYPDEHPVKLVHAAGTNKQSIESLKLYEIDRSTAIGLTTTLFVPPMDEGSSFEAFLEVVAHLRAPDGCPWDKEQTHLTLRPYLLEETYELLSALDEQDPLKISEELGDLLLQVYLHAQIAGEVGDFTISDVLKGIYTKITNRHPHVFGNVKLEDTQMVLRNWERLKEAERTVNGKEDRSLLDGVSIVLPALIQADQYQKRAGRVGFDWKEVKGVYEKVLEEIDEVKAAHDPASQVREIGDLLFSVVNLARWYGVDAESALREANERFRNCFSKIEQMVKSQGGSLSEMTLEEIDKLWDSVKESE